MYLAAEFCLSFPGVTSPVNTQLGRGYHHLSVLMNQEEGAIFIAGIVGRGMGLSLFSGRDSFLNAYIAVFCLYFSFGVLVFGQHPQLEWSLTRTFLIPIEVLLGPL